MEYNLIFQPIHKAIATFTGLPNIISEGESKGLSNEKFKPPYTANKVLSLKLLWINSRLRLRFEGSCLKQEDKAAYTIKNVVSFFLLFMN